MFLRLVLFGVELFSIEVGRVKQSTVHYLAAPEPVSS
ncbi:hypothetical protein SEA_MARSHAWN_4 [Mycobacterium phage Marshawn]|uniref:Uncharacterized protein n=1 Tax=Mycobacterium phage Marshawn TaxID=2652423 RepID=A0A5P8D9M3_9CAUD|nr:hypothetical protein I5H02_gp95 [Mycobacterium phage Marshawn]QFP94790.1 hypothetical protein SEA_MARSHAWN_4 [Mycobacterium phage Marshawn]